MRVILDSMIRRLLALVVALALMSAPVALAICQVTCESKGMPLSMAHGADSHPAHHEMPADHATCHDDSGASPQLFSVNGLCDHDTGSTPTLAEARYSDIAGSLLATLP